MLRSLETDLTCPRHRQAGDISCCAVPFCAVSCARQTPRHYLLGFRNESVARRYARGAGRLWYKREGISNTADVRRTCVCARIMLAHAPCRGWCSIVVVVPGDVLRMVHLVYENMLCFLRMKPPAGTRYWCTLSIIVSSPIRCCLSSTNTRGSSVDPWELRHCNGINKRLSRYAASLFCFTIKILSTGQALGGDGGQGEAGQKSPANCEEEQEGIYPPPRRAIFLFYLSPPNHLRLVMSFDGSLESCTLPSLPYQGSL